MDYLIGVYVFMTLFYLLVLIRALARDGQGERWYMKVCLGISAVVFSILWPITGTFYFVQEEFD